MHRRTFGFPEEGAGARQREATPLTWPGCDDTQAHISVARNHRAPCSPRVRGPPVGCWCCGGRGPFCSLLPRAPRARRGSRTGACSSATTCGTRRGVRTAVDLPFGWRSTAGLGRKDPGGLSAALGSQHSCRSVLPEPRFPPVSQGCWHLSRLGDRRCSAQDSSAAPSKSETFSTPTLF